MRRRLDIREGKNPALCLREKAKEIIPLSLSIGGELRTLVITGPNAGGKDGCNGNVRAIARYAGVWHSRSSAS